MINVIRNMEIRYIKTNSRLLTYSYISEPCNFTLELFKLKHVCIYFKVHFFFISDSYKGNRFYENKRLFYVVLKPYTVISNSVIYW